MSESRYLLKAKDAPPLSNDALKSDMECFNFQIFI